MKINDPASDLKIDKNSLPLPPLGIRMPIVELSNFIDFQPKQWRFGFWGGGGEKISFIPLYTSFSLVSVSVIMGVYCILNKNPFKSLKK